MASLSEIALLFNKICIDIQKINCRKGGHRNKFSQDSKIRGELQKNDPIQQLKFQTFGKVGTPYRMEIGDKVIFLY